MPNRTIMWVDEVPATSLTLPDRGLDYGDGLFETLMIIKGELQFPELHLARLQRGCEALHLPDLHAKALRSLHNAASVVRERGWPRCALRITGSRGEGPRGYTPPHNPTPRIITTATELEDATVRSSAPARLGLASMRVSLQPALAGIKHLNRLEQVLAAREYSELGHDEAVMLDQSGRVSSVVAGNLYIVVDDTILTAPIETCAVAGTRRELLIKRLAPALGVEVREQAPSLQQLEDADEVFFSNTLVGFRPVGTFGKRAWKRHTVCEAINDLYIGLQS